MNFDRRKLKPGAGIRAAAVASRRKAVRWAGEPEPRGLPPPAPGAASARRPSAPLRLRGPGSRRGTLALFLPPPPLGVGVGRERGAPGELHLLAAL